MKVIVKNQSEKYLGEVHMPVNEFMPYIRGIDIIREVYQRFGRHDVCVKSIEYVAEKIPIDIVVSIDNHIYLNKEPEETLYVYLLPYPQYTTPEGSWTRWYYPGCTSDYIP